MDGLLVLDKPAGITSRRAVDRAIRWFPRGTRVGHTGTLDPLATGVLVLCLGQATRLAEYVQRMGKVYRSLFCLGATSDTDDAEGHVTPTPGAGDPGLPSIEARLTSFVGLIEQVPPAFSAAHVGGRRAHDLARSGKEVVLTARPVRIDGIAVRHFAYPQLEVEVRCGKGTYIRSLARDLGRALGCGAYVQTLRRLSVGPFEVGGALPLDATAAEALAGVLPVAMALGDMPRVVVGERRTARLRAGQALDLPDELEGRTGEVGIFNGAGEVVAVGVIDPAAKRLKPEKVFAQLNNL